MSDYDEHGDQSGLAKYYIYRGFDGHFQPLDGVYSPTRDEVSMNNRNNRRAALAAAIANSAVTEPGKYAVQLRTSSRPMDFNVFTVERVPQPQLRIVN